VKKTVNVVLDSFALLSLFHKEPGWETVRQVLQDLTSSGQKALLSVINWGDFYYIVKRKVGKNKAEEVLALPEQLPVEVVSVDKTIVKEAAEIKSDYPVSYADAFCVALAQRANGAVFTNDPEFKSVEHLVQVAWLTA
jgi:predicted nucleic acid-binding protein